ncbi:hypothetical protein QJS10_CPB22g00847 [Acorus calamus]|uniref:Uncharacterized protein n=1 Tax=Acorus calamus TaxID=4465 RepID=A0AAV9C0B8_ACOCL|nr:hypothetical protein QJS10_CPB22g00847 [Acorus calamus]
MLWDIRKNQHVGEEKPVAVLDGHEGQVSLIHMDPYKVVTGGPHDSHIRVWETDTGVLSNSMSCCIPENEDAPFGCSAMAVDGFRMVTGACGAEEGLLCFRDYSDCSTPISSSPSSVSSSRFWETAKFGC